MGDPRWDLASIFGEFLLQWILSMPVVPIVHPQEYMKMAIYKIKSMKPAMKSFWYTYNRTMEFEDFTSNQFLLGSMSYLSMKLINSVFELTDSVSKISNNAIVFCSYHQIFLEDLSMLLGAC